MPHARCGFEYTSGGSCGCACIIPPKTIGHLPPVGQKMFTCGAWGCLPTVFHPRGAVFTCGAMFTSAFVQNTDAFYAKKMIFFIFLTHNLCESFFLSNFANSIIFLDLYANN